MILVVATLVLLLGLERGADPVGRAALSAPVLPRSSKNPGGSGPLATGEPALDRPQTGTRSATPSIT